MDQIQSGVGGFEKFFAIAEPALRRALVAGFGAETGRDATAAALTYGWHEWDRVSAVDNGARPVETGPRGEPLTAQSGLARH